MYAEKLFTPHPLKAQPEEGAGLLVESLELRSVSKELAVIRYNNPAKYDKACIDVAESISREVNRALWYPVDRSERDDYTTFDIEYPITLDSIEEQLANCYGYTYITSELLETAGIEHWVGYSTGLMNHAFVLLPPSDEQSDGLYFIDALLPQLNHTLNRSVERGNVTQLKQDINTFERSAFILNADEFSNELNANYEELSADFPWLVYAEDRNCFHRDTKMSKKYDRKHQLVTTIYTSEAGREVIDLYGRYQQANEKKDYSHVANFMTRMRGKYPSIDARQNHADMHRLVDWLCEQNQQDTALRVIDDYFSSFDISNDTRIPEAKADMHLRVAKRTGSLAVAEAAELIYLDTVDKRQCFRGRIESKIDRVKHIKSELSGA